MAQRNHNPPAILQRIPMSCELSAPGWLAKRPAIGIVLFLVGSLAFGLLANQLWTNGPLIQLDNQLAITFQEMAPKTPGPILEFLTYGFFMGKEDLQMLGAVLVLYFLYKRYWAELGMIVIGWM